MIQIGDLNRLVTETSHSWQGEGREPVGEWCEREGVSEEAITYLSDLCTKLAKTAMIEEALDQGLNRNPDTLWGCVEASVMMAFVIGWEAHREYGKQPRDM